MQIPKFHETFNPIIDILGNKETIHTRDLYQKVIDKYYNNLTPEQLKEKTKTGDLLINNRIAWGKSYLKKSGFIEYPERGFVRITQKGLQQNNNNLTLRDVVEDKSMFEFYQEENSKNITPDSSLKELKTSSPQDLIDEGLNALKTRLKTNC